MSTPTTLSALCLTALLLGACDPKSPPLPKTETAQAFPGIAATAGGSTSVPDAGAVFSAADDGAKAPDPALRANRKMSPEQESQAMPLAGQANDHSAPAAAASAASAASAGSAAPRSSPPP